MDVSQRLVTAVYVFDGAEPFPLELVFHTFRTARRYASHVDLAVNAVTMTPGRIRLDAEDPLELSVTRGLEAFRAADLVIFPTWPDLHVAVPAELIEAVQRARQQGTEIVGLSTGVMILAQAGLLDDQVAVVRQELAEEFGRLFPRVRVRSDILYHRAGAIVTAAGREATTDCCLTLLGEHLGLATVDRMVAHMVARQPRAADESQAILPRAPFSSADRRLLELVDWMRSHLREPQPVGALAARVHMTERTLTRRFQKLTGLPPRAWLSEARVRYAKSLLKTSTLDIASIAAVSGFGSAATLRRQFREKLNGNPTEYRLHPDEVTQDGG